MMRTMSLQAHVEIIPASPEQEPVLANLLELYDHDFSEFQPLELGPDGRFGYKDLPSYWREPGRHPFLVRMDGNLAGLILVKKGSAISGDESVWDMTEFFVVRAYRRQGIGTEMAHRVWRLFPGCWEVRVLESNLSANRFWDHVITKYAGDSSHSVRIEKGGQQWRLFTFESAGVG
jgi:predicted acetyltransferase